jgi:hypothetical protein
MKGIVEAIRSKIKDFDIVGLQDGSFKIIPREYPDVFHIHMVSPELAFVYSQDKAILAADSENAQVLYRMIREEHHRRADLREKEVLEQIRNYIDKIK